MRWQTCAGVLAWLFGLTLAARLDPTAVQLYATLTIFTLMLRNLGQRRTGPSAYSVFNANCEALPGQLDASQFENEIRHRPLEPAREQGSRSRNHDTLLEEMRSELRQEARRSRRPPPGLAARPVGRPRR